MIAVTYAGLRWGGSGPLIPRSSGFNGGIVFDCPRFARAFCYLCGYAFAAFLISRC